MMMHTWSGTRLRKSKHIEGMRYWKHKLKCWMHSGECWTEVLKTHTFQPFIGYSLNTFTNKILMHGTNLEDFLQDFK